jgi:DNA/RNA endonuclease YhcR with UshA esterase domain
MIAFIIFFAGLVAIGIVLSICNFFSETYQEVKEKERYDLEQKKKQDEFALEAQRKKAEQELEFRKQAGLDPIYQEQTRKNKQYKAVIVSLIGLIIFIGGYILFSNNESVVAREDHILLNAEEIADASRQLPVDSQQNQDLPERFMPSNVHEQQIETDTASTTKPIDQPKIEEPRQAVLNPFEGNIDDKNLSTSGQISVYEADAHIGESTIVCGEVSQISQTSKATYINFGGIYPKHKFSAVIWSNNIMPTSEGSNICITGLVESYKGVPQIVIRSVENQISSY